MPKILLIKEGCDWTDAHVSPVVKLTDFDAAAELARYNVQRAYPRVTDCMSFEAFLLKEGLVRHVEPDELETIWED